jgi:hypothetical protein
MLPIHSDDAKRQTALYLRGLVLLHEALFQHPAAPIERQADKELVGMNLMQKASR